LPPARAAVKVEALELDRIAAGTFVDKVAAESGVREAK